MTIQYEGNTVYSKRVNKQKISAEKQDEELMEILELKNTIAGKRKDAPDGLIVRQS